jgi:hypothetical protein
MHEQNPDHLERSPTAPSLVPQAAGLVAAADGRSLRGQRRGCEPMDDPCPRRRSWGITPSLPTWCPTSVVRRTARSPARSLAPGPGSLRLSRGTLDPQPYGGRDSPGIWCDLPSRPYQPCMPNPAMESPKARPRARQRDETAMARWRNETWPAIKKGRRPNSKRSSSEMNQPFTPCPASSVPMRRSVRPPCGGNGGPAIISPPSVRSRLRASGTATVRRAPLTRRMSGPSWNTCCRGRGR